MKKYIFIGTLITLKAIKRHLFVAEGNNQSEAVRNIHFEEPYSCFYNHYTMEI